MSAIDRWISVVLRREFRPLQADWEDLRQEASIRILRNLRAGRFSFASELRTYVHRIAKNVAIDAWRSVSRRSSRGGDALAGSPPAGTDGEGDVITRDLLAKLLADVSDEDRHLLEMIHGQHLSYAEIARSESVAEGTVKARVFRCRQRLLESRRRLMKSFNP
ncbi:MAG: RNA polymerase sigma factor [Candidatus Polarisedimenticolia bacterium]